VSEIKVRKATRQDFPALKRVLARAFDDDPLVNWLVFQDGQRLARIERFFTISLERFARPYDQIYTTPELNGAALWIPPGKWGGNLLQQLLALPDLMRITGPRHLLTKIKAIQAVEKIHPATAHYYLITLGVEPHFQRKGIGSVLLQPILQLCDEQQIPAYLETAKEQNLSFYARHGFQVREIIKMPQAGPTLWTMWRDP
jgi:N-acetylglutamate synthase-like GNAT family acetyltransferase